MKILLPVDGSDCSKEAVRWAARTLNRHTSEYCLLSVIAAIPESVHDEYEILEASRRLKEARQILESSGVTNIRSDYCLGDPQERICAYAKDVNADQIVIGSHGRDGLARFLLGSVSEGVLKHADCPVIVYRPVRKQDKRIPAN